MAKVEQKHLAGLTYRTAEKKEYTDENDQTKKMKWFPIERPLTLDDLLAQKDNGDSFHIVTKDGKKYDIPKAPAAGGKEG